MASTFPTLPVGPLPHPAQDYEQLLTKGIEWLGKLAGTQWTDFNAHDPGITILEQLCYAITDLAFRVGHPVPDVFFNGSPLPGPADVLTGDPVTLDDLRRLALDVDGVENAWVEEASPDPLYYHPGNPPALRRTRDPLNLGVQPIRVAGLRRVLVLGPDDAARAADVLRAVSERLHDQRLLGTDLVIEAVQRQTVAVSAELDVDPIENPASVLARVIEAIEEVLAPSVRRISAVEALASGQRCEDIFEGPCLNRGQLTGLMSPARIVQVSDLVHAILDVPSVRAVRTIQVGLSEPADQPWAVSLPPGMVGRLGTSPALAASLKLFRGKLALPVEPLQLEKQRQDLRKVRKQVFNDARALSAPEGRDRNVDHYRSIRRHLPAAYGLPSSGLSPMVPASRQAAARQLEAYLLIFDQLLANQHAQLAHSADLLGSESTESPTYFAQTVTDLPTDLLNKPSNYADVNAWLAAIVCPSDSWTRRKRMLAHLLARHAEDLGQGGIVTDDKAIVAQRASLLRDYPRLSGGRGTGGNRWSGQVGSAFAERMRIKLGMPANSIHVVEHLLLRPLPEDLVRDAPGETPTPLLDDPVRSDPWSMQMSIVLDEQYLAQQDKIQRLISAEAPAHLRSRICWLTTNELLTFTTVWAAFRSAYSDVLQSKTTAIPAHFWARDARDFVLEMLGIGGPWPLRDLPVVNPNQTVVGGQTTTIQLGFAQKGVTYQLVQGTTVTAALVSVTTSGAAAIVTPAITVNVQYAIQAFKTAAPSRTVRLTTPVKITKK